nr:glycosyltransferase family 4 protein [Neiella litorisoli]
MISANTSWYVYNFRKNTILSLIGRGYSVTVLSPADNYVAKLEALGVEHRDIYMDRGGKNPLNDLVTLASLVKFFFTNQFDLLLNFTPKNNIYGTLVAKAFGLKIINNISGLGSVFVRNSLVAKLTVLLYKLSQRRADVVFFQNIEDKKLFLKHKIILNGSNVVLPGSGVDLQRFKATPSTNDGVLKLVLVARMLVEKGVCIYAEAARILKQKYGDKIEFRLLGIIDSKNKSAIKECQIRSWVDEGLLTYLGESERVEIQVAEADCVVLPSYYREGIPRSLLEAAAMAKPIITTDNVGCRETVVNGVNGLLCRPNDVDSLVSVIEKMYAMSHEERLTFGRKSRQLAEQKFDEHIVISSYLSAIDQLA